MCTEIIVNFLFIIFIIVIIVVEIIIIIVILALTMNIIIFTIIIIIICNIFIEYMIKYISRLQVKIHGIALRDWTMIIKVYNKKKLCFNPISPGLSEDGSACRGGGVY